MGAERTAGALASRLRNLTSARLGQADVFEGGDAGRAVASLYEPLERSDERAHDWLTSDNALNCTHAGGDARPLTASPLILPETLSRPGKISSELDLPSLFLTDLCRKIPVWRHG